MNLRKIARVLALSFIVMLILSSAAMCDDFELRASEDIEPTEPTIFEEDEENEQSTGIVGYNYLIRYRLPEVELVYAYEDDSEGKVEELVSESSYTISWDIDPEFTGNNWLYIRAISTDASGDFAVVNGILPSTSGDYEFYITAEIVSVDSSLTEYKDTLVGMKTSFDSSGLTITVADDAEYTIDGEYKLVTSGDTSFDSCVTYDELNNVSLDYSVTINAPQKKQGLSSYVYSDYIISIDQSDNPMIDLPEWLTYTYTADDIYTDDFDYNMLKSITIKYNDEYQNPYGILKDGTVGAVHVPLVDADGDSSFVLGWNVTFVSKDESESETDTVTPISLAKESLSFSFTSTTPISQSVTYSGLAPVSYAVSESDITSDVADMAVASDDSKITVTIAPVEPLSSGNYGAVITFTDSADNTAALTISVTITPPSPIQANRSFDICSGDSVITNPVTVTVKASGDAEVVTFTASGDLPGNILWSISPDTLPDGLKISPLSVDLASTESADFTISASGTTSPDTYTFEVNAVMLSTDNATQTDRRSQITLEIKVTEPAIVNYDENSFDIYVNGSPVENDITRTITAGRSTTINMTVSGDVPDVIQWTVSNDTDGLTITPVSQDVSSDQTITFTISAAESLAAGVYSARIKASPLAPEFSAASYNQDGKYAYAGLRITVTEPSSDNNTDNSDNNNGDSEVNESGSNIGKSSTAKTSTFNFSDSAAVSKITSLFTALSGGITEVADLLEYLSYTGPERSVCDSEEVGNGRAVLVFPIYRVSESKIYLFAVTLQDLYDAGLIAGAPIYMHMTKKTNYNNAFYAADANSSNACFVDDNGNLITSLPPLSSDAGLNVAAYMEANVDYSPVITTAEAGTLGAANLGCNSGLSAWGLLLLIVPLFALGRRYE